MFYCFKSETLGGFYRGVTESKNSDLNRIAHIDLLQYCAGNRGSDHIPRNLQIYANSLSPENSSFQHMRIFQGLDGFFNGCFFRSILSPTLWH